MQADARATPHKPVRGTKAQRAGERVDGAFISVRCDLKGSDGDGSFTFGLDEKLGTVTVDGSAPFDASYGATSVSFKHDAIGSFYKEMVISRIDLKVDDYLIKIGDLPIRILYSSGNCTKNAPIKRAF